MSSSSTKSSAVAMFLASLAGALLIFALGRTLVDAFRRMDDAPLRAMLGNADFERLSSGDTSFPHYLGKNRRAPDFTLGNLNGEKVSLRDFRGKTVVLNFWTKTCKPCLEELPSLERLAQLVEEDEIEVVLVSIDKAPEAVRALLPKNLHATYLFDPENSVVLKKYGTRLFPETWIVDANGNIRFRYDGKYDWSSPVALDVIRSF